jgi:diguanylate cyclase (GGDEF)-like protein
MPVRLTISRKFFGVLMVLGPLMVALAVVGVLGLRSMKSSFDLVFARNIHVSQVSTTLGADLSHAEEITLQLPPAPPGTRRALNATLAETVIPEVSAGLSQLAALHAHDDAGERGQVAQLDRGWARFLSLDQAGRFDSAGHRRGRKWAARVDGEIAGIFSPLRAVTQAEAAQEQVKAAQEHAQAERTYDSSLLEIAVITVAALVLGIGSVLLLTRNVVPRIQRYSRFASAVADGDLSDRLDPRGSDELAALGCALDEMVEHRSADRRHVAAQDEFVTTLQVTDSEELAHDLLKRQVQRSISHSSVVVLNRNNSENRLEATTALPDTSTLNQSLVDAKPRSCLAVRFAHQHSETPDQEPLTRCEVCGHTGRRSTCEPLLVGGEVIGAVLVEHDEPLAAKQTSALQESVSQAAPVLANLRNLALAEFRAATDGLTGLPNKRAVIDTVRRMAAYASRSVAPLSAIALDLDHFKEINDTYGHDRGDDVLAAVGAVLSQTVRASDFVGRNGGEEFIVLLPDTDTQTAARVAEKLRTEISNLSIPGVTRDISASLGIATIPDHAGDGDQVARSADRALYLAKTNGRNRVETAIRSEPHPPQVPV